VEMEQITKLMINEYKLKELGYDFMGFSPSNEIYTAHHLIIPKRAGGKLERGNVAILMQTPHSILHKIESYNFELFSAITGEMIDEVVKGKLDDKNILEIYYLIDQFYNDYKGFTNAKGNPIIDKDYKKRLVLRR
jgi:hypothetical protein